MPSRGRSFVWFGLMKWANEWTGHSSPLIRAIRVGLQKDAPVRQKAAITSTTKHTFEDKSKKKQLVRVGRGVKLAGRLIDFFRIHFLSVCVAFGFDYSLKTTLTWTTAAVGQVNWNSVSERGEANSKQVCVWFSIIDKCSKRFRPQYAQQTAPSCCSPQDQSEWCQKIINLANEFGRVRA